MKTKSFIIIVLVLPFFSSYAQDGTLDLSFDLDGKVTTTVGTFNDRGNAITLQADNKILVAGQSNDGSKNLFTIIRYNSNGALDSTFGNKGVSLVDFGTSGCVANAIAIQEDKKIIVGGHNNTDFALARLNQNGTLDTTFDKDGKVTTSFGTASNFEYISALTVLNDGKIIAAGTRFSGNYDVALAKFNSDGSLDISFDLDGKVTTQHPNGLNEYANAMAIENTKILVAGYISTGSTNDFQIIRYNSDGSLDTSFDLDGKVTTDFGTTQDIANSIKIQNDGKVVVAGASSNGINSVFAIARYNSNGMLDTSFDSDGKVTTAFGTDNTSGNSVHIQDDGKIIVAGSSNSNFALARYAINGTLDASFGTDGKVTTDFNIQTENGLQMTLQTDGKIVLVGNSFSDFTTGFALARYNNSSIITSLKSQENSFAIFQNPVNELLNIGNNHISPIDHIVIFDVSGKKLYEEKQNVASVNIQNLTPGLYFLNIECDGKIFQNKFIKE